MKTTAQYIIWTLVLSTAILMQGCGKPTFSRWVSLHRTDKNPYGYYVLYEGLKQLFNNDTTAINTATPIGNNLFTDSTAVTLLVIPCTYFKPDYYNMDELLHFVHRGNNVFLSSFILAPDITRMLDVELGYINHGSIMYAGEGPDSMSVHFNNADSGIQYKYPGKETGGYFVSYNHGTSRAVASDGNNKPNLLELHIGKGKLFINLSPLTLSNYFLLSGNNYKYFENLFSQAGVNNAGRPVQRVIWDEYFMYNESPADKSKAGSNWFSSIMKNPSFKAGILLALLLLGLYTLLELRRRQQHIPVYTPPANDSLDFVKTMGLLYYDRSDHTNLAQKMGTYFMEHVHNKYKLFSKELNNEFIEELSMKSGTSDVLVRSIVEQINQVNLDAVISETALIVLKQNIETFHAME